MNIESLRNSSPIIIVGAARSGTKFLRDLLASDPRFSCVPYDVNYIWRIGNENVEHDELAPESLTSKNRDEIIKTLYKLANITSEEMCMVEKSVSNGLRIAFISKVFPNARFIHLVRDGRAVVESSLRMWNTPPQKTDLMKKLRGLPLQRFGYVFWFAKNYLVGKFKGRGGGAIWGPRYNGIQQDIELRPLIEVVAKQWSKTVDLADQGFADVPREQVITVQYESLMNGVGELKRIADFIGLVDLKNLENLYTERVIPDNAQKWQSEMDEDTLNVVGEISGKTLKRYNYV